METKFLQAMKGNLTISLDYQIKEDGCVKYKLIEELECLEDPTQLHVKLKSEEGKFSEIVIMIPQFTMDHDEHLEAFRLATPAILSVARETLNSFGIV